MDTALLYTHQSCPTTLISVLIDKLTSTYLEMIPKFSPPEAIPNLAFSNEKILTGGTSSISFPGGMDVFNQLQRFAVLCHDLPSFLTVTPPYGLSLTPISPATTPMLRPVVNLSLCACCRHALLLLFRSPQQFSRNNADIS